MDTFRFIFYGFILIVIVTFVPALFGVSESTMLAYADELEQITGRFWTQEFAGTKLSISECNFLIHEASPSEFHHTMNYFLFGTYEADTMTMTPLSFYIDHLDDNCQFDRIKLENRLDEYTQKVIKATLYWNNSPTLSDPPTPIFSIEKQATMYATSTCRRSL